MNLRESLRVAERWLRWESERWLREGWKNDEIKLRVLRDYLTYLTEESNVLHALHKNDIHNLRCELKAWKFQSLPFEFLLFSRRQWPREFILFWSDASLDIEAVRGGWLNFLRRSNEGSGHEKYLQYFAHSCNFHEKCESNLPGSWNRSLLSLILRPLFS